MKTCKYLLMGALLLGSVSPVAAQELSNKQLIEQATQVIKSKGADYDKQVKNLYKQNKKNPEVLVGIGRALYNAKDYVNAEAFADYALQAKGGAKYAPAFLLKGDICVSKDDGGGAAENYSQAKLFAPKDPEAYYKYAMVMRGRSPEEAVKNLEELRTQRPDYPVDALCGRIYYLAGRVPKAAEYFEKVADPTKMEDEDLTRYGMAERALGNYDKSTQVMKSALTKDPRRLGWNRIVFWNYAQQKDAPNALEYADRLFNKSDSAKFIPEDYYFYGMILNQEKRYDDAIAAFGQALDLLKVDESSTVNEGVIDKELSDVYLAKNDYEKAVSYLDKSFAGKQPTSGEFDDLGRLYADIAQHKSDAGDKAGAADAYRKADEVYGKMMQAYPVQSNYCNFMRANLNSALDDDGSKGLAKPYYEAVVSSLAAKDAAELTKGEQSMLKVAYQYLAVYQYNKKNVAGAKDWAEKLSVLDPTNELAKQIMSLK